MRAANALNWLSKRKNGTRTRPINIAQTIAQRIAIRVLRRRGSGLWTWDRGAGLSAVVE
jgi:hypothetical protein